MNDFINVSGALIKVKSKEDKTPFINLKNDENITFANEGKIVAIKEGASDNGNIAVSFIAKEEGSKEWVAIIFSEGLFENIIDAFNKAKEKFNE